MSENPAAAVLAAGGGGATARDATKRTDIKKRKTTKDNWKLISALSSSSSGLDLIKLLLHRIRDINNYMMILTMTLI